jgi:hypothetical protein
MSKRGAQECGICGHTQRAEIEAALSAGTRYKTIAAAFQTSAAALSRHRSTHMPDSTLPVSAPARNKLLSAVDLQINELRKIQARAKRNKNSAVAADVGLKCARELRSWFSLRMQIIARAVETESTERGGDARVSYEINFKNGRAAVEQEPEAGTHAA